MLLPYLIFFTSTFINISYGKSCNILLSDVNIKWYSGPLSEALETRYGLSQVKNAYKIEIVNESIGNLCKNTFKNFENLYALNLESNKILKVEPGAFMNLENLRDLNLSRNFLTEIERSVFNNLKISILRLQSNLIETIHPNAFDYMPNLRMLYLGHNNIQAIDAEWFANTPNINQLSLERNAITSVSGKVFQHLKGRHTIGAHETFLNIDLSNNKIKYVDPKAFDGLDELGTISLDGNAITTLNKNTFSAVKYMKSLLLTENKISCLPTDLSNLLKAEVTDIDFNPWNCKCAENAKKWAEEHSRKLNIFYVDTKCLIEKMRDEIQRLENTF